MPVADDQRYSAAGERLAGHLLQELRWSPNDMACLRSGVSRPLGKRLIKGARAMNDEAPTTVSGRLRP
jgi:hypothetical protein